jgi:outer membrane protein TolC
VPAVIWSKASVMKLFFLFLVLVTMSAFGQVKIESAEKCLEYVRLHNLSLQNESLNEEVSRERLRAAWALMLPQLKAFGTLDDNISLPVSLVPAQFLGGPEGEFAQVQFGTQYNATYGAEASLSLINASNWKNVKAAAHGQDVARYQRLNQEQTILEQATTAYYLAILSREASLLNQDLVKANDSLVHVAEARFINGVIEPLEYNRIKAIYLESQYQLSESEAQYHKNINALKVLMGIDEKDSLVITEQISSALATQSPTLLTATVDQSARYKLSSARVLQSQQEWQRQRARVFPELSIYARYTRQTFSNEFDVFGGNQPWFDVAVVGVRAEWNLFTGFNRQASIRQASLQSKIAQRDAELNTLQTQRELDDLERNYQSAAFGLGRYTEHFQLNRTNYTAASEKYKQGVYTLDQFITVYQEMVRSQNQYLSRLANYLVYDSIIKIKNQYQVK